MIIIAGYTLVDAAARDTNVAAFQEMVGRARAHDGCLDLAIGADALDPRRVNIYERWRDQATLDAWRKVARAPRAAAPPEQAHVFLYRTDRAEPPFQKKSRDD